jgi:hypothetical protein
MMGMGFLDETPALNAGLASCRGVMVSKRPLESKRQSAEIADGRRAVRA